MIVTPFGRQISCLSLLFLAMIPVSLAASLLWRKARTHYLQSGHYGRLPVISTAEDTDRSCLTSNVWRKLATLGE
jgi:hypothetical protein